MTRKRWCRTCAVEGRRTEAVPRRPGSIKFMQEDAAGRLREMHLCEECRSQWEVEAAQDDQQEDLSDDD